LLKIKIEKRFKRDIERDGRSGNYSKLDFEVLKDIIERLQEGKPIDHIYKKHRLNGEFNGYEAIHIKNDWILIFRIEKSFLKFAMIGKHIQIYKKF